MNQELTLKNKYYRFFPLRFVVDKIIDDMVVRTVDVFEKFINSGEKVLDIGSGGGWISRELKKRKDIGITLLDVTDFNQTDFKLIIYNGKEMPFTNNTFDTSFLICVLHHCQNPLEVLKEATRVTKDKVIIIEDVHNSAFSRVLLCLKDIITNLAFSFLTKLAREITNIPFNFKKIPEWEKAFKDLNLKVIHRKKYPSFFMAQQVLFVLQKHKSTLGC